MKSDSIVSIAADVVLPNPGVSDRGVDHCGPSTEKLMVVARATNSDSASVYFGEAPSNCVCLTRHSCWSVGAIGVAVSDGCPDTLQSSFRIF